MRKTFAFIFSCLFAFSVIALAYQMGARGQQSSAPSAPGVAQSPTIQATVDGRVIPITLRGVDGRAFDFASLRGEAAVISFGATWCAPCADELEALEALRNEYSGRPVRFFWVSIETEREASNSTLRRYARTMRFNGMILRDPLRAVYAEFASRVRMPMIVFLDRAGRVAGQPHFGMSSNPEQYKQLIRQRLNAILAPSANTTGGE